MTDTLPVVSVIMPTFNAADTVGASIQSVIDQTFERWELIIVDDCSTDNTLDVVEKYSLNDNRIHIQKNDVNQGVARTRNNGINLSRGEFIAFIDSDDVWDKNKLDLQLKRLDETNADICYTSYALVDLNGNKVRNDYIVPEKTDLKKMLCENVIGCSTVVIKSDVVKKILFSTDFYHEDYLLWLTALKNGYCAVGCKEVLVSWCYREGSRSFNKFKSLKERWKIYRKGLQLGFFTSLKNLLSYCLAGLKKYKA